MTTATSPRTAYTASVQYFYVPSSRQQAEPGDVPTYYVVSESATAIRCDCTAGRFGKRCWHVAAVEAGMVQPARLNAAQNDEPRTPVWAREVVEFIN